jgi:hypothetical protein
LAQIYKYLDKKEELKNVMEIVENDKQVFADNLSNNELESIAEFYKTCGK